MPVENKITVGNKKVWWEKYNWAIVPSDKIHLEVNGKTKFIGSAPEPSMLAILPMYFQQSVTAFLTEKELKTLLDDNTDEVEFEVNKVFKIKVRKLKYISIIRDSKPKIDEQDNNEEKKI
jgi:hypothetical protein